MRNIKNSLLRKKVAFVTSLMLIFVTLIEISMCVGAEGETENSPPVADAGGTYDADEGMEIVFDASGSSDLDGDILSYRWNFEGEWTEWSGNPYAYYTWFDDWVGMVSVEVTDGEFVVNDTATVTISNVAPIVVFDCDPFILVELGTEIELAGEFRDPGSRSFCYDTHIAIFDWGDGSSSMVDIIPGDQVITGSHIYSKIGQHVMTLTVIDDDGGIGLASVIVIVESSVETIDDLVEYIEEMNLSEDGLENSLLSKLDNANEALNNNQKNAAINKLNAFINQVEAQRGKKLTEEEADALIANAQVIIDNIND